MKYQYKGPGAPQDIPADVVGTELQRIYEEQGRLTPLAVVDEARPDDAPLHTAFEWDDSIAAEQHRQAQARMLVRSVVLVPQPERGESAPVIRAFVSLMAPEGGHSRTYKPTMEVLANPVDAEQVKTRLRNELLSLRRRYMDMIEVSEMLESARAAFAV